MEWRCEWCGKPHEDDDPPCDNCGHGTFERAVVREAPAVESTTVWVCTECGREHTKHTPPCSRCGNGTLERQERTVDDEELTAPGYLDLVTPRYVLGLTAALVLGAVLILGVAGIIPLPGLADDEVPAVSDVPGDAESVDGASLAAVEAAYVERFNALRTDAGETRLERHERLDAIARFYNQHRVKRDHGDGTMPTAERMGELFEGTCGSEIDPILMRIPDPASVESADALGAWIADRQADRSRSDAATERGRTGVDVHAAPDGTLYVTQFSC